MELQTVEQYQALIDHSTDVIAQVDENGVVQFVSPSVEEMLGYSPDDLVGEPAFGLLHPDDRATVIEAFDRIVEAPGESTERQEHRFQHADGSWIWAESVTTNRVESALDGYVINSREITERKRYEAMLEDRTEELEALNQVVRHDIRNDMGIILGWARLLEEHVDCEGEEYLERVFNSGEHIVELTDIAREYVETVTGETDLEVEPTSLRSVLETELALRREAHPATEFVSPEVIPDIEIVANDLLGSVFRNLLNNAVQHNDSDTPVVEITCTEQEDAVVVRVADNGPGIPDDHKDVVFGKGEKGLASPGTGIGLYLVQTLIDQYDGAVWIEDNEPTGTIFNVQLRKANGE